MWDEVESALSYMEVEACILQNNHIMILFTWDYGKNKMSLREPFLISSLLLSTAGIP